MKRKNGIIALGLTFIFSSAVLTGCGDNSSSQSSSSTSPIDSSISPSTSVTTSSNTPISSSFVNPGDYMGGGEIGTEPDVNDPESDEIIEEVTNIVDIEDSDTDLNISYLETDTMITLSDGNSSFVGSGVTISNNVISITEAGTYVLSGTLSSGHIYVNVDGNVHLVLNGVSITSNETAAIAMFGKKKKVITVVEGTVNTLTDASVYSVFYNTDNDEPNGALFSKKALTINGSGELIVNGHYNNGISCKDQLKILDADVTVSAQNNAIKGNDAIVIKGASLDVTSVQDGIKSDSEDEGFGYIYIEESSIDIEAQEDAIQAFNYLQIVSGDISIITGGGSALNTTNNGSNNGWGSSSSSTTDDVSRKAIKCDNILLIQGGTITIDSYDDSIHSDNTIVISGGTINIKSGDDGIHADNMLTVNGGIIDITKSYEGLESAKININGGQISVVASDDGINAADGTTSTGMGGNSNCYMLINGGNIYVNAQGDGVDSNGAIQMNNGALYIDGPSGSGNGSLDTDSGFLMNGGVLFATGSLGMVETPASNSSQCVLSYASSSNISANTTLTVTDASGKDLVSFTPTKTFRSVIVSIPDFAKGSTYSIKGDSNNLSDFTINSIITVVGSSTGGNFGGGGHGGRPW